MDIKMALLRPLEATLLEVYRLGDATEQGQSIAQAYDVQSIAQAPHLVLAIVRKKNHIFQGCILDCSPNGWSIFMCSLSRMMFAGYFRHSAGIPSK